MHLSIVLESYLPNSEIILHLFERNNKPLQTYLRKYIYQRVEVHHERRVMD